MKTISVRSPQGKKKKDSGLTSVRVRINESGLLVRSIVVRGSLTISMKCLGHEALRGHVQCVYRITAVPISLSLVTQAGLLENLHRLDTMIVEEVAKKGRHTITRLGARFGERRTSRSVGLGYAVEFRECRDSMQQGGARQGGVETGGRKRLG
jgi:hypothetical protein